MNTITTIGLDMAKRRFAVHGFDVSGVTVLAKELKRGKLWRFSPSSRLAALA
jgi:hypothetical protein